VPFLDLELMRYAESLPPRFKIRGRTQKWLLKRAVAPWIPPRAVQRRKVGFRTPVDEWFRSGAQSELTDRLRARDSACATYLRRDAVTEVLDDHRGGRHDLRRILFGLLTFELWHEEFMERLGARDKLE
jgi:asparagine synthase (glutamine-hydrolysing)